MPFRKGFSGNPTGARPHKAFADALRIVAMELDKTKKRNKLRAIADRVVECAVAGEPWAVKEVADRLDGKPAQEQVLAVDTRRDLNEYSDAELMEMIADCQAKAIAG
jgi:CO/xanthine dehydrogenase FAD-binding subunit